MVASTPIDLDHPIQVTQLHPVDLTGVRDPGMRALVLLAASLGWNVMQKINNPIALIARDGMSKRLPTNTSIRMSVFQSALSTILVHTEGYEATPELIDAIVHETKIDRDHERRLRLAIGETPDEHKRRVANEKVAEQKRQPDEHLTQRIEVPEEPIGFEVTEMGEGPHDRVDHGGLVSRKPFMAHHQTDRNKTHIYESDTSLERVWADGYKDYECVICGRVFSAPKGVGGHSQVHTKAGEKDSTLPAWQRARMHGIDTAWEKGTRRKKAEIEGEVIPVVEDLVFEEPPEEHAERSEYLDPSTQRDFGGEPEKQAYAIVELPDHGGVIDQIAALVSPQLVASREIWKRIATEHGKTIDDLSSELDAKSQELEKLKADWEALKGLIDGR